MEALWSKIRYTRGRCGAIGILFILFFAFNALPVVAETIYILNIKQSSNGSLLYVEYGTRKLVKYTEVYVILNRNSNHYLCMQENKKIFSFKNIEVSPIPIGRFKPQQELMPLPETQPKTKSLMPKCLKVEGKLYCPHWKDFQED